MINEKVFVDFDNSKFNASTSALKYVCDNEIKLTWAHNLLIYESQSEYVHILAI